jgi:YbbR domain-containing protein
MFNFPKERIIPTEERWQIIKGWLRTIFLEDWITKVIALFITLVIWYGVTGRRAPTTVRMRSVHLSFRLPSDTEIANEPVDEVEITVTGDKTRLDRLNPRDLAVAVDLGGYKTGDLVVQLKPDTVNLELPAGVKLEEIEPNKIALRLEQRIEKMVEVRPVYNGQLPEGFELYSATVVPQRVRVRGAASQVEVIDRVSTEKINLEGLTEDAIMRQVTVDLLNPKVTVLDALVDVALKIGEQRAEKVFAGVAVREAAGANASPQTATVVLYGVGAVLNDLQSENMQILLETGADNQIVPRLVLPPEVEGRVEMRELKPSVFSIGR